MRVAPGFGLLLACEVGTGRYFASSPMNLRSRSIDPLFSMSRNSGKVGFGVVLIEPRCEDGGQPTDACSQQCREGGNN